MRKIVFIFLLLNISYLVYAQSPEEIFQEGNAFYENRDYEKAISLYEGLIKMDIVNKGVFYNLGNSYFKTKRIGKAILNYERALRLAPRDRDIRFNLRLARSQVIDKLDLPEDGFIKKILFLYERVNIDELTIICSISYTIILLMLICSIFFIRHRKRLFYGVGIVGIIFLIFIIFLWIKINKEEVQKYAIIISEKVDIRSGPKEDYLLQFTLHEGTKLRVLEERQGWYQIELSKDLRGWLPKETIEII